MLLILRNAALPNKAMYVLTETDGRYEWSNMTELARMEEPTFVLYDDGPKAIAQFSGEWLKWPELELGGWNYIRYSSMFENHNGELRLEVASVTMTEFIGMV